MTFDLVLSSLFYHAREWFVFQDILTHLPLEKAAVATQRSKNTQKYTYRFGITRDWVTGDSKKVLVDRHFIDSNDPGRSLIFSSVLIDAERVQELFIESFNKKFRLKVQQFHLTATTLDSSWFEWHFDPKQKDGCPVKKTKLTEENDRQSSKPPEMTPQKNQNIESENVTPNLSSENQQSPSSLKRRRAIVENEDQPNNNYLPTISETVLIRPRKKAKEANLSISKHLDEKPDTVLQKDEPMSPDFKPDFANLHNIKRSLSPMEKPNIKLSPSSSLETPIKEDVMLNSVRDNNADDDFILPLNDITQNTNTTPHENIADSQNGKKLAGNREADIVNDIVSQDSIALESQDMPNAGNAPNNNEISKEMCSIPDNTAHIQENVGSSSNNDSMVDCNNSGDRSSTDDDNVPDSNIPDDSNIVSQNDPTSPTSLLDNTNTIMEKIKLQKQELCTDEEEGVVVVDSHSSEVPSTSAGKSKPDTHKHDCGAETCSSNGASSTVCLCSNEEQETSTKNVKSTGISCVLGPTCKRKFPQSWGGVFSISCVEGCGSLLVRPNLYFSYLPWFLNI